MPLYTLFLFSSSLLTRSDSLKSLPFFTLIFLNMPDPLPSVGFRAEFLIGFTETDQDNYDYLSSLWKLLNDGGPPPADPPPLPDPLSQVIRLPVRSSPDSHDRVLLGAVVNAIGSSLAVSEFIEETDPIYPLLTTGTMRRPPVFAKDQFWFTHRWFVASAATSRGHYVSPLVPNLINPPPHSRGRQLATPPLISTFSWRPVTVITPVFQVSDVLPDMFTLPAPQQDFAARLLEAQQLANTLVSAPMQNLRSSLLTQLNISCSFVVHVGLGCPGEGDDTYQLLTLKKMVTILWLGGEAFLAKLAGPKATAATPLLTESAGLRVRSNGFSGLLLNILDDDEGSNAAFDKWLSPLLGPAPVLADVRRQVSQRGLADYALRQETMSGSASAPTGPSRRRHRQADNSNGGLSSSRSAPAHSYNSVSSSDTDSIHNVDPARRAFFFNKYGVDADVTLAHELYLIWRARDVDTIARLLTPHFWKGPSSVPLQHCAIDFVNLRNDVREERGSAHHPTIVLRLLPATLDPTMVLAWTRLSAGLAAQAAVSTPDQFRRICNRLLGGPKDGSISPGGSTNSDSDPSTPVNHRGSSLGLRESPGGSSGNDGDIGSSGNSSDSDDSSPDVAPELLIPFHQALIPVPPVDSGVAPPGLALPHANEPAPRDSSLHTDHLDVVNYIYEIVGSDNHASGTEGWTSDSLPYTSEEYTSAEEEEEALAFSGAQPILDIMDFIPDMNLLNQPLNPDEIWPSSPSQYLDNTSASPTPGPQEMDTVSSESESSSSAHNASNDVVDIDESPSEHAMDTDPDTSGLSSSSPNDSDINIDAGTAANTTEFDRTATSTDGWSNGNASAEETDPTVDGNGEHGSDTDGWTSDSPPYTSDNDANASVDTPMDDSSSSGGHDHNNSPPPPAQGTGSLAVSFEEDSEMSEPSPQSSREGSPIMDDRVRDNSDDLDVDTFDVWAFVRWLNVGSEPLETLRRFVEVNSNVNPDDQPMADGGLPFVHR